jgi:hypothetical protein
VVKNGMILIASAEAADILICAPFLGVFHSSSVSQQSQESTLFKSKKVGEEKTR